MKRFVNKGLQQWLQTIVFMLIVLRTESSFVDITFVQSAVEKGAVCLDGSPPAYYLDRGFGKGINSWLVHFEGGGWCESVASCLTRRSSWLGSTTQLVKPTYFSGILSNYSQYNPDFYNWNRVMIRYCDGSSFTGDVEAVDPATKLYYRGGRIFYAVMQDLLEKGMKNAENAMLSGCSAGGLTSILHCDSFRDLLPTPTNVKCIADAGYFINVNDTLGNTRIQDFYNDVVALHGSAKNLPTKCTSEMEPSLCFFPQNMAKDIQTPLFIINSPYDTWQIYNILAPGSADLHGHWNNCTSDLSKCTGTELQTLHGYRSDFIEALTGLGPSKSRGYFINSCYTHCQTEGQDTWFGTDSPMLNNKTIAKAVGDWFYDRSPFQKIDCPYPCDKTCHNQVFGQ